MQIFHGSRHISEHFQQPCLHSIGIDYSIFESVSIIDYLFDLLDDVEVLRVEGVHDPGVLVRRRLVVDPVHVGHEDGEVGLGLDGDPW